MRTHDVHSIIDNAPFNRFHWLVVSLCALLLIFDGYDLFIYGVVLPSIMREWGLTPLQAGALGSYALFGMMFGALIFGTLADRFGRKKGIVFCFALFSIATVINGFASSPTEFGICRFIAGLGCGGLMPNAAALINEYAPKKVRSTLMAFMFSGYSLGGMLAASVGIFMLPAYGWSSMFFVAVIPLLLLPVIVLWLPESIGFLIRQGRVEQARVLLNRLSPDTPINAGDELLIADVKSKGVLSVATEDDYAPFNFIVDGKPEGFHKDLLEDLKAYAKAQKFDVEQDILPWTGLLAGITSGKYDAAITGAGVTEERLGAFDFVVPVAPEVSHYIKRADDERIKGLANLSGLTVGVQAGGAQLARLTQLDAKLKSLGGSLGKVVQYQSYPEAYADLANGRLDYVVNSIVPANMLVKERPKVFAVGEPTSGMGFIAWPVAKGNTALLEYLSGFVNHLRDTGKLAELQEKWLGQAFDNLPREPISSVEQFKQLTAQ